MGSEMCIRDRTLPPSGIRGPCAVLTHVDECVARDAIDRAQSWTCLLYTSDAADERSSVDLGGRRILKKKT